MPGLRGLVEALRSGLDPTTGYSIYSDIQAQREEEREEQEALLRAEQEEAEAEREARRAARQEQASTLGGLLMEQAQSGMPFQATSGLLDAYGQIPGVNLGAKAQRSLGGLLEELYPRTEVPVGPQRPIPTREGGIQMTPQQTRPGPRGQSPLYQPDPMAQRELMKAKQELMGAPTDLPSLADIEVPGAPDQLGKPTTVPFGPAVAQAAQQDKAAGLSMEQTIQSAQQDALMLGQPPDVLVAIAQQIQLLWDSLPEPKPPPTPRPAGRTQPSSSWGGQPTPRLPFGG